MEKKEDVYKTVNKPSPEILYKDRKSKFYAEVHPITSEDDVKPIVEELRKKYHTANHVCYAWQLGVESPTYRANDDGEPNNSAGMPIYGQIQSVDITNVLDYSDQNLRRHQTWGWWLDSGIQNRCSNGPGKCQDCKENH